MNLKKQSMAVAAVALSMGVTVTGALPASADEGDVIRNGSCARTTDWKLKASPQNGRIEVEGEIDSNRRRQTWRWLVRHDGSVSARGTRMTRGRSGSFTVRRVMVNMRGTDTFVIRARNVRSGEVCRGIVRF